MRNPLLHISTPYGIMMSDSLRITAACFVLMIGISGCGSPGVSTVDPTKADELLTHVKKAIETKDWKTAESEATAAIEANVLDSSQHEDALIARTQARLESNNLSGAGDDLVFLENSDSPTKADEILVLKATHQLKTGNKSGAKKTFQLAKKINKKIKAPAGL